MTFDSLGLSPALLRAARERGHAAPTAIQTAAIPPALRGADVLGCAQTGSGKTHAFAWPVLQRLAEAGASAASPRPVRALILAPTRELAIQVGESMLADARQLETALRIVVAFGGVSINPQMMRLRGGADIVIATPGRLLDLVDRNALRLAGVRMLVLDEADRLLDLGFADELRRILALMPAERQTLCFSATFPRAVRTLADAMMRQPVPLGVPPAANAGGLPGPEAGLPEDGAADSPQAGRHAEPLPSRPAVPSENGAPYPAREGRHSSIAQRAIAVDAARRTPLLLHLIRTHGWTRVLVFVASQYASEHVAAKLRAGGLRAEAFHGDLSQGRRTQLIDDFKSSRLQALVATDLAARGLDIAQLPVVVNHDLPRSADDHVHRIGRSGRAGEPGLGLSFVSAATEAHFRLIEKRQQQRVPRETIAGFEPTEAPPARGAHESPDGTGGVKGSRPSKKDKLRAAQAASGEADSAGEVRTAGGPAAAAKTRRRGG